MVIKRFISTKNYSNVVNNLNKNQSIIQNQNPISGTINPKWIPFNKAKHGNFVQQPPVLNNQFIENIFLRNYLFQNLPRDLYSELELDLTNFGERVSNEIYKLGLECENNKPYLRYETAWNSSKNELIVCEAWNKQKEIAAEEGLISIGYDRNKYGRWARIYQHAKLYLYAPSSGLYSCPLAMTDGAAKSIESLNLIQDPYFFDVYKKLTSNDPQEFWTSGQWMTEKGGGSDVANGTETLAVPVDKQNFKLYGLKWFSSATDANMALTLARIVDNHGNVIQGGKGLTLFYVPVKENKCQVQENINIVRLKDKLGTRQLPTAELLLDGVPAIKISDEGRGIASISHMLQITRLHNATSCSSYIKRAFSLAKDYSQKRLAFGRKIIDLPLHIQTLARIDLISDATFIFSFENARLLGLIECGLANDEEKFLFRILNPLAKLYNSKAAINAVSESIECIGGQGVIEDTGIPYLYRDVQIFSIWEGTTSVLALDVIRSIMKTQGETLKAFRSNVKSRLEPVLKITELKPTAEKVSLSLDELMKIIQKDPSSLESGARDFAFSLSNLFISTLLLENAIVGHHFPCYEDKKPITNNTDRNNHDTNNKNSSNIDKFRLQQVTRFVNTQNINPFITNYHLNEYSSERRLLDRNGLSHGNF